MQVKKVALAIEYRIYFEGFVLLTSSCNMIPSLAIEEFYERPINCNRSDKIACIHFTFFKCIRRQNIFCGVQILGLNRHDSIAPCF